jgi:hypothetical protein
MRRVTLRCGLRPGGGHIFSAEVVWAAMAGLRLVVRALELVLLTAPTRLWLQLLAFLIPTALLLLATLAALRMLLITFLGHQITPCCDNQE